MAEFEETSHFKPNFKTTRIFITQKIGRDHKWRTFSCGASLIAIICVASLGFNKPQQINSQISPQPQVQAVSLAKPERPLVNPGLTQYRVERGETLLSILADTGVHENEAKQALSAMNKVYNSKNLGRGQRIAIEIDASEKDPTVPVLSSISMPISKLETIQLQRGVDGKFKAKKIEKETVKALSRLRGTVKGSFYKTAQNLGVSPTTISELIKAYSYDIDFQRDLKAGDKLEVVIEQTKTKDGAVVANGGLVYASLDLGKRKVAIYRHADGKGNVDYYNEKGESLKKALLKTPINGARITSGFGMRVHPIMGYNKMHKGVDFGASQGTPIYAAGDGTIKTAGWQGGYGNLVVIQHTQKYSTAYGHASRIAKGIAPGKRVRQGDVIAYVGSTGNSTGPHLHYEVRVDDQQVNPNNIKFKTGTALAGVELSNFKKRVTSVQALLGTSKQKQKAAVNVPQSAKKKSKKT